ncbi:MAG: cytidylate kinase family protein [Gemmatimonadota bacterium]|jgi:cytidylate kinase
MAVVLISRGTMSGSALLVDRLRQRTGVRCVSREDLVELVNRHGELARRIVDRLGDAARDYEEFCDLRRPYLIFMRAALLEYAREDDLVYHGFSGHLLLPPIPHFVTVRLQAPPELRVRMTMQRRGCTESEARSFIDRDDEERVRWARFVYGKDIRDPGLYDLCINLKRTGAEAAGNIVEGVMADPAWQATPESEATVERLWLATRIEAALLTDPRTDAIEAGARVSNGRVTITGPYLDDARRDAVVEIASGVARASDVEYECGFLPEFDAES